MSPIVAFLIRRRGAFVLKMAMVISKSQVTLTSIYFSGPISGDRCEKVICLGMGGITECFSKDGG